MDTFSITTWNLNGIRARMGHLGDWLRHHRSDVVCLQETKVQDEGFPVSDLEAAGYHVAFAGQKSYNGVAILSRHPTEDVRIGFDGDNSEEQKRIIAATILGVRVVNIYIPNGSALDSPKFLYKIEWLAKLSKYFRDYHDPIQPLVLVGDFNIAADERDVYDVEAMRGQIHFSAQEHEALAALQSWGFVDCYRKFHQEAGQYTWWDFRQGAFRRNWGLRIDHVWGSLSFAERTIDCWIAREERAKEKPSDHAPVVVEFAARG